MSSMKTVPAGTVPETACRPYVTCAKERLFEYEGYWYSTTGLIKILSEDPTRCKDAELTAAGAGTVAGAAGGVLAAETLLSILTGPAIVLGPVIGAILGKNHDATLVVINACPEDVSLSDTGTTSDGNPYLAHGQQPGMPVLQVYDPTSKVMLPGRVNTVPAARRDASGAQMYGMATWFFENNSFRAMSTRGTEGALVLEGEQKGAWTHGLVLVEPEARAVPLRR